MVGWRFHPNFATEIDYADLEDDATEFAYGVGARWRIDNFGVQLEYEKFDTDVVGDLDLISLGATYTFDMM